jgi:hypothetical protein
MILTTPSVEMQLASFKGNEKLINEIKQYLKAELSGVSAIRIESASGNGSSFLLHSVANELRRGGQRISFLHLTAENKLDELTSYHISDILSYPIVFIDNVHFALDNIQHKEKFGELLHELSERNLKLIYSCRSENNIENQLFIDAYFSEKKLHFRLDPITIYERREWAIEKLSELSVSNIPEDIFSASNSNFDFIQSLTPFLEEYKLEHGTNFKQLRHQEVQLYNFEIRILKLRLATLELQPVKDAVIREQRYEKAADIREQQKYLKAELELIRNELDLLTITPKSSEAAMRLYIYYVSVQNKFKLHEEALFHAVEVMKSKLDDLNAKKKELDIYSDKQERKKVFQEIVNWTDTLNRFYVKSSN